jgi:8-oxo-dGTP pyrophosphatase MutT (NUDIX family)
MSLFDRLVAAAAALPAPPGLLAGDDFNGTSSGSAAAVLIAVIDRPEPGIILTVRRPDMRTHPGQIAFPGGRLDPGESAVEAALREAEEETGLPPAKVRIAGCLDRYHTITGYDVAPVLGLVPADIRLSPHESEVADLFEAPLAFLLNPANHDRRTMLFDGAERHYWEIMWGERRIWGATAAMIVNLSKRLQWP